MRKKRWWFYTILTIVVLILTSCENPSLPWRSGRLVTQLYRQNKSQIWLAYNEIDGNIIVDEQYGYERGFFDNYRREIIFIKAGKLEYLINNKRLNTARDGITGYVEQVVLSPDYQIGIEILDFKIGADMGSFWGEKTRIMNLQTLESVTVDGAMFAHAFIAGNYLYNIAHDYNSAEFLNMIDLETMTHTQIKTGENDITFLYQIGAQVYAQVASKKTAFLLDGMQMIEDKEKYDKRLPSTEVGGAYATEYLDDVAPINSGEHWYVEPVKEDEPIRRLRLVRIHSNGTFDNTFINFKERNVEHITDVTNYGSDYVAILYRTKDIGADKLGAHIGIYDLNGGELETREVTSVKGEDDGRFMYLSYVV